ncbi:MAG TPA: hypothetical protein PLE30_10610 [Candidatus Kapabacteria bacterium]|nr:hypothetical protein [Candidatus Kapabacteria bacterium]
MEHLYYFLITLILIPVSQWLISIWIKAKIESSVKHDFNEKLEAIKHQLDKNLEDYKFEIERNKQSSKIAEFLSFWVEAKPDINSEDRQRLNQLSYEMSLWLPVEIYNELAKTLQNIPGSKTAKDILIGIRKIYHGSDDTLKAETIIHWEKKA